MTKMIRKATKEDLARIAGLSGGRMDVTVGSALSIFGGSLDLDELAAEAASYA